MQTLPSLITERLIRLATVRVKRGKDDTRHSTMNFNLKFAPGDTSELEFRLVASVGGEPVTDVSVKVSQDNSYWLDSTIWTGISHGDRKGLKLLDDLYISGNLGKGDDFFVEVYAVTLGFGTPYANESWMGSMQALGIDYPLLNLAIPGTHDSGTYSIGKSSPVGDDKAGADYGIATVTNGSAMVLARAQGLSVAQQLLEGVRYLDLRVDGTTGSIAIVHAYVGEPIEAVMQDVREFLDAHPHELIILDFQKVVGLSEDQWNTLGTLASSFLDKPEGWRPIARISPGDAFSAANTLREFKDGGYSAIVLVTEKTKVTDGISGETDNYPAPDDFFTNYPCLTKRSEVITSPWPKTSDLAELKKFLDQELDEHRPAASTTDDGSSGDKENQGDCTDEGASGTSTLFVLQGIQTPGIHGYAGHTIENWAPGNGADEGLNVYARDTNPKLVDWMSTDWSDRTLNIVIADFVEKNAIPANVIARNFPAGALTSAGVTRSVVSGDDLSLTRDTSTSTAKELRLAQYVTVQSTEKWQLTSIYVSARQRAKVSVKSGAWTAVAATGEVSADGDAANLAPEGYPMPGAAIGALIARVGVELFAVGSGAIFAPAISAGMIELCINDDSTGLQDNTGSLEVHVVVALGATVEETDSSGDEVLA